MKHRILLFFLPMILMVSCSIFGAGYIEFMGSGGVSDPTCWIKVTGESSQPVYFWSPSFRDAEEDLSLIFSIVLIFKDDFNDVIYHQAQTQIQEFAVTNQGYWFKLSMTGYRTASLTSDVMLFHEGDPEVLRFEDDISTFSFWVHMRDVRDVDEGIFENNCLSLIEAQEFESLGIDQYFYCEIIVNTPTAELRVGPGMTRAIRSIAEFGDKFDGIGLVETDGELWYEVKTNNGNLWLLADSVNSEIAGRDDIEDANCRDLPTTDSPPIIQAVQQNNNISSLTNCSTFTILRPIATVPNGESTYMWSLVDEADQYILNFSDYLGNYVTSMSVDGADNSVVINTGLLATGSELSFEIVAMANGEPLCRSFSGSLTRTAGFAAEAPTPEPTKEKKKSGGGYTPPSD